MERYPIIFKWLGIFLTGLVVSFFLFPIEEMAIVGNSKKALAALGLVAFVFSNAKKRSGVLNYEMATLCGFALIVSVVGWVSIVINNTHDVSYANYLVSMAVWVGAAYFALVCIRLVHGYASLRLVTLYLAGVCLGQCAIALLVQVSPMVKRFIDAHFEYYHGNLDYIGRWYGMGAKLDPSGAKFAGVLVIIAAMLVSTRVKFSKYESYFLCISFIAICVIGNIIARTTTVGIVLAFAYLVFVSMLPLREDTMRLRRFVKPFFTMLCIALPLVIIYYNNSDSFARNFRFGFEGFFNLIEQGHWETKSNNQLMSMYDIMPTNWKTWFIGDGFFDSAKNDPYYIGGNTDAFYMGTDVGYFRFIFYFGVIGLAAFLAFLWMTMKIGCKKYPHEWTMFALLLLTTLSVFFKVATDIFMLSAIFIMVDHEENSKDYLTDESLVLHRGYV